MDNLSDVDRVGLETSRGQWRHSQCTYLGTDRWSSRNSQVHSLEYVPCWHHLSLFLIIYKSIIAGPPVQVSSLSSNRQVCGCMEEMVTLCVCSYSCYCVADSHAPGYRLFLYYVKFEPLEHAQSRHQVWQASHPFYHQLKLYYYYYDLALEANFPGEFERRWT